MDQERYTSAERISVNVHRCVTCGSTAIHLASNGLAWSCVCPLCGMSSIGMHTRDRAIAEWEKMCARNNKASGLEAGVAHEATELESLRSAFKNLTVEESRLRAENAELKAENRRLTEDKDRLFRKSIDDRAKRLVESALRELIKATECKTSS